MNLVPIGNVVIVKRKPSPEQKRGGVIIPEAATPTNIKEGEVIAVGPGVYSSGVFIPLVEIKVGDVVLYNIQSVPNQPIVEDGEEYLMLSAPAVLAVRLVNRG